MAEHKNNNNTDGPYHTYHTNGQLLGGEKGLRLQ